MIEDSPMMDESSGQDELLSRARRVALFVGALGIGPQQVPQSIGGSSIAQRGVSIPVQIARSGGLNVAPSPAQAADEDLGITSRPLTWVSSMSEVLLGKLGLS